MRGKAGAGLALDVRAPNLLPSTPFRPYALLSPRPGLLLQSELHLLAISTAVLELLPGALLSCALPAELQLPPVMRLRLRQMIWHIRHHKQRR